MLAAKTNNRQSRIETMDHVLALDQGTTSSRAILFDRAGRIVASAQKEFRQHYPQPGWVEHDPAEIWATQLTCAQTALRNAAIGPARVAAVGITNQRETALLWDRTSGVPIAPAIVWQDRRTAGECAALREQGHEERVRAKTGLVLDPYFSATKIAWLLDHVPGARARADRGELAFGTVDSWLIWNLTGGTVHVTDVSNASRTLLDDRQVSQVDGANSRPRRPVEVERQHPASGSQHAVHLAQRAAEVGNVAQAVAGGDDVERGVRERERHHVGGDEAHALRHLRLSRRELKHAVRNVEADDAAALRGGRERDITRPASKIQHPRMARPFDRGDELRLPAAIEAARQ